MCFEGIDYGVKIALFGQNVLFLTECWNSDLSLFFFSFLFFLQAVSQLGFLRSQNHQRLSSVILSGLLL